MVYEICWMQNVKLPLNIKGEEGVICNVNICSCSKLLNYPVVSSAASHDLLSVSSIDCILCSSSAVLMLAKQLLIYGLKNLSASCSYVWKTPHHDCYILHHAFHSKNGGNIVWEVIERFLDVFSVLNIQDLVFLSHCWDNKGYHQFIRGLLKV